MAPTTLTPAEAHAELASHVVIDVRAPGEYAAGHLPGALNVPLDRLADALTDLRTAAARDRLLITCASGVRAGKACETLELAGTDAALLEGGTNAWTEAGFPVERADGARAVWAMERQVRLAAGGLVLTGLLAGRRFPKLRLLSGAIASGLIFSAVSDTCGMAAVLAKLPHNQAGSGDTQGDFRATLAALRG